MVARFGTEWEDNVDYAYDEAGYNYDALSRTFAGAGFGTTHKFTGKERDSESLTRKTFTTRPRSEGLWVRLRFKDNEILEGLMPSDLTQNLPEGYLVNPPDQRSNTQRIFVPRTALDSLTVLAVIGATRRPRRGPTDDQRQVTLFEE
jgi:hypothetical protein